MKRIISIILTLGLLLTLMACGGKDPEVTPTAGPETAPYSAKHLELPIELTELNSFFAANGRLYLFHTDALEDDSYIYRITSLDETGGDPRMLFEAEDITDVAADADGTLWVLLPGGEDTEPALLPLAPDGTPGTPLSLPESVSAGLIPSTLKIDGDGNFYLIAYDMEKTLFYVLAPDASLLFELPMDGVPLAVITTAEGAVGVCPYDLEAVAAGSLDFDLILIDPDMKSWGNSIQLGIPQGGLYDGASHSFYMNDTVDLYCYDAETGESEVLLNWLNTGAAAELILLTDLGDGRLAMLGGKLNTTNTGYEYSLALLGRGLGDDQSSKQVLTLSCLIASSEVSIAVAEFNKVSEDYRIDVKSYLTYNDLTRDEAVNDALTQFASDIITGHIPDLLDLSNMPVTLYAAKGLLEDLYPYIDADPDLSREDFFENLLAAMSIDGKLPYVTSGVYLYTLMGDAAVLGLEPGLTAAELGALLDAHPDVRYPLGEAMTKDTLLTYILYGNLDFIDWDTGTCRFDSPAFIELLELANRLPAEPAEAAIDMSNLAGMLESSARIEDGAQLAAIETIFSVDQLASYNRTLDGRTSILGLPAEGSVCHVMDAPMKLAISSTSPHKDAAWSFVRTMLEENAQLGSILLPIGRAAFRRLGQDAIDGKSLLISYFEGLEISQADVDMLESLMESTHYATSYDSVVLDLVLEEAAAYFGGDRSAAQVAANIQSRIQLYVNEQF